MLFQEVIVQPVHVTLEFTILLGTSSDEKEKNLRLIV